MWTDCQSMMFDVEINVQPKTNRQDKTYFKDGRCISFHYTVIAIFHHNLHIEQIHCI